jgi:hypothetical protein
MSTQLNTVEEQLREKDTELKGMYLNLANVCLYLTPVANQPFSYFSYSVLIM